MFEYKYQVSWCSYAPLLTMWPLSIAKHDHIITLLNSGTSAHEICHATGASTGDSFVSHCIYAMYCKTLMPKWNENFDAPGHKK
jgi:hypothetical protein